MRTSNMNSDYVTVLRRNTDAFFFFGGGGGQDSWELSSVLILELNSVRYLRLEKLSGGGRETSDVITEAW